MIEHYLFDNSFTCEGWRELKSGDCLTAFALFGMSIEAGAQFNRRVLGLKDLTKLMEDLKEKGF